MINNNNVHILKEFNYVAYNLPGWNKVCTNVTLIIIIFVIIFFTLAKLSKSIIFVINGAIIGIIGFLFISYVLYPISGQPVIETLYEITIDEDVSLVQLQRFYHIIEQYGNVYLVQRIEKEE